MSILDVVRINDVVHSYNSLIIRFDGIPTKEVVSIDFEQKRERKVVYGARRDGRPLGKTAGKYSVPTFNLKMLTDGYDLLTDYFTPLGIGSYGDYEFTVSIESIEETNFVPLIVIATGCTIDGEKDSYAEGIEENVVEVEIGALTVTRNGKQLWSAVRSLSGLI